MSHMHDFEAHVRAVEEDLEYYRVRVLEANPAGNPRTPAHLRGKAGIIVELCGTMDNPLDHRGVYPPLCKVQFAIRDVFGGDAGDKLFADIHEDWLEPV